MTTHNQFPLLPGSRTRSTVLSAGINHRSKWEGGGGGFLCAAATTGISDVGEEGGDRKGENMGEGEVRIWVDIG